MVAPHEDIILLLVNKIYSPFFLGFLDATLFCKHSLIKLQSGIQSFAGGSRLKKTFSVIMVPFKVLYRAYFAGFTLFAAFAYLKW
jgi:hypothetical protein